VPLLPRSINDCWFDVMTSKRIPVTRLFSSVPVRSWMLCVRAHEEREVCHYFSSVGICTYYLLRSERFDTLPSKNHYLRTNIISPPDAFVKALFNGRMSQPIVSCNRTVNKERYCITGRNNVFLSRNGCLKKCVI
jgi:hypothetical protein